MIRPRKRFVKSMQIKSDTAINEIFNFIENCEDVTDVKLSAYNNQIVIKMSINKNDYLVHVGDYLVVIIRQNILVILSEKAYHAMYDEGNEVRHYIKRRSKKASDVCHKTTCAGCNETICQHYHEKVNGK